MGAERGIADGSILMIADQDGYHEVRVFQVLEESLVGRASLLEGRSASASDE